jgi:RNA polymerase sigma-70 factor, ECF subfamily
MRVASPDDLTLRRAVRREPVACRALVLAYQQLVFTTAARVLGRTSHDVADVAQESFFKMFQALDRFDPAGPALFSTWLVTLTTRVAIDHVRRRRSLVSLDEVHDHVADSARDPGDQLDDARRLALLATAMEALSPDQRAAMLLRTEYDMSYEDIAAALAIEVGTVRSRLSRARATLAAALESHHEKVSS